jgi:hypothetical protein
MHAAGAARQRDVEAVVDDDLCRRAACHRQQFGHDVGERCRFEIALAHLDQIDASVDAEARLRKKTPTPIRIRGKLTRETPRISDETDGQEPGTRT